MIAPQGKPDYFSMSSFEGGGGEGCSLSMTLFVVASQNS